MKKTIISMALLALIGAPGAIAQSGSKGTSVGSTINGTVPEAPVGHRQPRASDVPNETSDVARPGRAFGATQSSTSRSLS